MLNRIFTDRGAMILIVPEADDRKMEKCKQRPDALLVAEGGRKWKYCS